MKNIRSYNPILNVNPSVMDNNEAPLADMPKEIQILYGYLKDASITELPDFKADKDELVKRMTYLNWRDMQFAIQHSLTTPWRYADHDGRPIGILNHLYEMKMNYGKGAD